MTSGLASCKQKNSAHFTRPRARHALFLYVRTMSARRGRRELQAGVERLENLWDNMVEKHLGEGVEVS